MQNGNGKRWLLIGGLILGGMWLLNDAYRDGLSDGLVRSGRVTAVTGVDGPMYYGGGGFPWGLLIVGGIVYFLWKKGVFGGPGRIGPGRHFGGGHGPGYGPPQMSETPGSRQNWGPEFRGPRAFFDDWHRQAHEEASRAQYPASPAAQAPSAAAGAAPDSGNGAQRGGSASTAPPTPPSPEYWAAMAGAAEAAGAGGAPVAAPPPPPETRQDEPPAGPNATRGAAGPALERW